MTGKKAQRKSSSISIQAYAWRDHRVKAWEKIALRAETSIQVTEPGRMLLWLSSRDGLQRVDFQESEVGSAGIQWALEKGSHHEQEVTIQYKISEAEGIMSMVCKKNLGKIKHYEWEEPEEVLG